MAVRSRARAPRAANPYVVGSLVTNASGTSFSVPVTTAMSAGDGLAIGSSEAGAGVMSAVSDTKGNNWQLQQQFATTPSICVWAPIGTVTPLTATDQINVTFSVSDTVYKHFLAVGVPGLAAIDSGADATGTGSTTAVSATSAALAATGETCITFCGSGNAGGLITWTSPAAAVAAQIHGGSSTYLGAAWRAAPSAAAVTMAGTLAAAASWRTVIVAFGAGVTTVSGSASVAGTAAVSAAGAVTFLGGASVSAAATISAAGAIAGGTVTGTASRPVTATVSPAGSVTQILSGGASRAVTAAVSAAGGPVLGGDVAASVAAAISADSTLVSAVPGPAVGVTATIRAGGSLAGVSYNRAYPRSYPWAYATFSGGSAQTIAAAVSAAGSLTVSQSATRAISAAVSAAGSVTALGQASRAITASVNAGGSVVPLVSGSASLPATVILNAAGNVTFLSGAAVGVSAAISASAAVGTGGLVTAGWSAALSAAGSVATSGGAALAATAALSAAGLVTVVGGATRTVAAAVSASGGVVGVAGATRAITATISAAGSALLLLGGDVAAAFTVAVSATGYASGGAAVITGGAMPWTFWADGAVSPWADIGPVQVVAFSYTQELSGFGSGEATIAVSPNSSLTRAQLMQLWAYRIWAFYGGQPVWAGCPTGVTDVGAQTVTVSLSELPGYLAVKQYATQQVYSQVEQTTIAADLAARLANIGVPVATDPGPGLKRDRTYTFLQADRASMLTDLSQVINGPEFRAEYSSPANPVCTFKIAYPRVGQAGSLAVVVPHGAISFRAQWASDMMRTRTFAVGDVPANAPTTATKPLVTVVLPQPGVPELDKVDDWPGVSVASTLNEYASGYAQSYANPALSLEAVMPLMSPPLGSYGVGDDVSVALADPLVPGGLNATGRLSQMQVDAGSGTVTWTVAITLPRPRKYATLAAQLKQLHSKTAGIFHQNLPAAPGGINP